MQSLNRNSCRARNTANGYSMIEVLVALLVTALGVLGFAMLQIMSLRYTQSANYRTQATNLAYDLLDQVRANRALLSQYKRITPDSFSGVKSTSCLQPMAEAVGEFVDPEKNMSRWRCQVVSALGENATANMVDLGGGRVQLWVSWDDMRSQTVGDGANTACDKAASSVCVETQL